MTDSNIYIKKTLNVWEYNSANKPNTNQRTLVSLPDLCTKTALGSFALYSVTFAVIVIHPLMQIKHEKI